MLGLMSPRSFTIPSVGRGWCEGDRGRLEVGFGPGAQQRVMKAASFRVGMSRLLPASPLGPLYSDTSVESVPGCTGTCITHEWVEILVALGH